ncbi:MAG: tRNA (adenosine(37)-N6)-dimethylallyltransferase MiaA [Gammaproteobacteria bacterium TMED78]|nr:MAG: tRNA (adenosine(37)-N6)-dimethylallyltransferase MiaA [Gammaproteobacteria bacterium TMED78]
MRECYCIIGPTACGKTDFAINLAEKAPLEVINMDSALVYRSMDIGTAKPSGKILSKIPHHLISIIDASETYSVGNFVKDANILIEEISSRGNMPILVGGTHLYLKAIRDGLADLPPADQDIRKKLDEEAKKIGWPQLHKLLGKIDPVAASNISRNDSQRIQRALEVFFISGEPISSLHKKKGNIDRPKINSIAILPESKDWLTQRITKRLDIMIDDGLVDEVNSFRSRPDMHSNFPSMRSVGYRQFWSYLDGNLSFDEAKNKIIIASRQLAKRQMTSLRSDNKMKKIVLRDLQEKLNLIDSLSKEINRKLIL